MGHEDLPSVASYRRTVARNFGRGVEVQARVEAQTWWELVGHNKPKLSACSFKKKTSPGIKRHGDMQLLVIQSGFEPSNDLLIKDTALSLGHNVIRK